MAATHRWTREAIGIMTAWIENRDKVNFPADAVLDYFNDRDDDPEADTELLMGFENLAEVLLERLADASGKDARAILQTMSLSAAGQLGRALRGRCRFG